VKKAVSKKCRSRKMKLHSFTWELLPPGTLKRDKSKHQKPEERWNEIQAIGSQIIAESKETN